MEYVLCDPSCSGSGIASRLLDDAAIEAGDASTNGDAGSSNNGGGGSGGGSSGDGGGGPDRKRKRGGGGGGGGVGGGGGNGGGGKKKKGASWHGSSGANGRPPVPIIKPAASPAELHAADRADNRLGLLASNTTIPPAFLFLGNSYRGGGGGAGPPP